MAALMLPSAVLAHLNAGVRAAFGPDPLFDDLVRASGVSDAAKTLKAAADDSSCAATLTSSDTFRHLNGSSRVFAFLSPT
jgi:hypothetical protein